MEGGVRHVNDLKNSKFLEGWILILITNMTVYAWKERIMFLDLQTIVNNNNCNVLPEIGIHHCGVRVMSCKNEEKKKGFLKSLKK